MLILSRGAALPFPIARSIRLRLKPETPKIMSAPKPSSSRWRRMRRRAPPRSATASRPSSWTAQLWTASMGRSCPIQATHLRRRPRPPCRSRARAIRTRNGRMMGSRPRPGIQSRWTCLTGSRPLRIGGGSLDPRCRGRTSSPV